MVIWCLPVLAAAGVAGVVVAGPPSPDDLSSLRGDIAAAGGAMAVRVIGGGSDRTASVSAALDVVPPEAEVILVHDAARPLIGLAVVERVIAGVRSGAAGVVPGLPVVDTVKQVIGDRIHATIDRGDLVAVQTPQGFDAAVLRRAYAGRLGAATDDAGLVEALGEQVRIVAGDPEGFKVTRPLDLLLAEAVLSRRTREKQ